MKIETRRLVIRDLEQSDLPALAALWSDPEVTRHMGGPRDYAVVVSSLAEDLQIVQEVYDLRPVIDKASDQVIGHCGYLEKEVDGRSEIELTYVLARAAWGKGLATEAAKALRDYAFQSLQCSRLIALIEPGNQASERVAQKIGMRFERETFRPGGAIRLIYAIELQTWNPELYARTAGFVPALGLPVLEMLNPQPGERILDLGCGDGVLTAKLASLGCQVVGVDSSPAQVAAAQARGLDARVVDAQRLPFADEFDAVFSNAALHWMRQPDAVLAGVWRALEPGGRFVGEMGGAGNIALVLEALAVVLARRSIDVQQISPWYFPAEDEYRGKLEQAGFAVTSIERFPRPTPLPGDVGDWLETFAGSFLGLFSGDERVQVIDEVRELLRPSLLSSDGVWVLDYVRLRFAATKPWSDADERAYAVMLADIAQAAAV
jgi:RimJ/RimL family protein N-acetyltransferase/precorrin-6B methylase 2